MQRFELFVPESTQHLLEYLDAHGAETKLLCNGSDIIPRMTRGELKLKQLVDLSGLKEFRYVLNEGGRVRLGALATVNDLVSTPFIQKKYRIFQEVADLFGAHHIRNVATVGGNVGAAASSEDFIPIFLALKADVKVKSLHGERVAAIEKFVIGKRQIDRKPGEIITEISFNDLGPDYWTAFEKIGRRNQLIIALVSLALVVQFDKNTKMVKDVRIGLNRVAGKVPERAVKTEQFLVGKVYTQQLADQAGEVLQKELTLTADYRASAEYRVEMAKVTLRRALNRCAERILGS